MSRRKPITRTREASTLERGAEMRRDFEIERRAIDEQSRTVELSFSSEAEVERWFGVEILDHSSRAVRLGRLRNGGALLMDHNVRDQIGVVENVRIEGGVGRATVRFGRGERASEIFQDVVDGIRRLVSVGYRVHRTETSQRPGGVEVVRVTDWEPYEISLVSVPADDSVGVGRSESPPDERNHNSNRDSMNREQVIARLRSLGISFDESASTEALRALLPQGDQQAPAPAPSAPQTAPAPAAQRSAEEPRPQAPAITTGREQRGEDVAAVAQRAVEADRRRTAEIEDIAERARANGAQVDHRAAIRDNVSVDAFRAQAFDAMVEAQRSYRPGVADGLSRSEQRDLSGFSIVRGLRNMLNGQPLDGIEAEMHQEAQREAQRSGFNLAGNFAVPSLVMEFGRRDMTATGQTSTAGDQGGNFVQTSLGAPIELLYARQVLRNLGAQVLTGLVGNIDLPKMATGSTVGNKAENAAGDESSPTTTAVSLSPKRATTFVELSRQLLLQSSPSIEAMVRNDLLTALALLLEARAINGSGSNNQPTGILNVNGIGSVVGGTDGAAPDWADIVGLETEVAVDNADIGSLAYLTNPKVRGKLKTTSKAGTEAIFVWGDGDTPLNGYRAGVTTQVPSNLTKGSSSGVASAIIFGNFSDLILAMWGGMDIMANPYSKDTEGLVRLTVNAYHDNVVRRAESFAAMKDALTA